jgi:hypothetical protein
MKTIHKLHLICVTERNQFPIGVFLRKFIFRHVESEKIVRKTRAHQI